MDGKDQEISFSISTEGPVRHGSRTADEISILSDDRDRIWPAQEVEVEDAADEFVGNARAGVVHVHAVAVEQEHTVRSPGAAEVEVERVGAVEVDVRVGAPNVGVPEGVGPAGG